MSEPPESSPTESADQPPAVADARPRHPLEQRLADLVASSPSLVEIGRIFHDAGHEIAVVGGPVRDALLGRTSHDLDLTTSARPDDIERLVAGWADAVWDVGRAFGTIGVRKGPDTLEITTYRADEYSRDSRKPAVAFGDSLAGDLARRDFTVNALALRLPQVELIDEHGGLGDLAQQLLRTPIGPAESFGDDPLRMLRAARFVSTLGFAVAGDVVEAMTSMRDRIEIVSAERIREELSKLVCGAHPVAGLRLLVDTGLAEIVLPELPALQLERDEHHRHKDVYEHSLTVLEQAIDLEHRLGEGPDLVVRLAALLHDIGKPRTRRFVAGGGVTFHHHDVVGAKLTRKRLKALRFSNDVIEQVALLVELHLRFHGYGDGEWTDSAVRRYVRDAGDELERLHILTRADSTTRNQRKAARLQRTYDGLEARIEQLAEAEELDAMRPDLDGNQIMAILGIGPGREVGQAYRHLLDLRLEHGPLGEDAAREALLAWAARNRQA